MKESKFKKNSGKIIYLLIIILFSIILIQTIQAADSGPKIRTCLTDADCPNGYCLKNCDRPTMVIDSQNRLHSACLEKGEGVRYWIRELNVSDRVDEQKGEVTINTTPYGWGAASRSEYTDIDIAVDKDDEAHIIFKSTINNEYHWLIYLKLDEDGLLDPDVAGNGIDIITYRFENSMADIQMFDPSIAIDPKDNLPIVAMRVFAQVPSTWWEYNLWVPITIDIQMLMYPFLPIYYPTWEAHIPIFLYANAIMKAKRVEEDYIDVSAGEEMIRPGFPYETYYAQRALEQIREYSNALRRTDPHWNFTVIASWTMGEEKDYTAFANPEMAYGQYPKVYFHQYTQKENWTMQYGDPIFVSNQSIDYQTPLAVAADEEGNSYVSWVGLDGNIYFNAVSSDEVPGETVRVNTRNITLTNLSQETLSQPRIVVSNGEVTVAWASQEDGRNKVYARTKDEYGFGEEQIILETPRQLKTFELISSGNEISTLWESFEEDTEIFLKKDFEKTVVLVEVPGLENDVLKGYIQDKTTAVSDVAKERRISFESGFANSFFSKEYSSKASVFSGFLPRTSGVTANSYIDTEDGTINELFSGTLDDFELSTGYKSVYDVLDDNAKQSYIMADQFTNDITGRSGRSVIPSIKEYSELNNGAADPDEFDEEMAERLIAELENLNDNDNNKDNDFPDLLTMQFLGFKKHLLENGNSSQMEYLKETVDPVIEDIADLLKSKNRYENSIFIIFSENTMVSLTDDEEHAISFEELKDHIENTTNRIVKTNSVDGSVFISLNDDSVLINLKNNQTGTWTASYEDDISPFVDDITSNASSGFFQGKLDDIIVKVNGTYMIYSKTGNSTVLKSIDDLNPGYSDKSELFLAHLGKNAPDIILLANIISGDNYPGSGHFLYNAGSDGYYFGDRKSHSLNAVFARQNEPAIGILGNGLKEIVKTEMELSNLRDIDIKPTVLNLIGLTDADVRSGFGISVFENSIVFNSSTQEVHTVVSRTNQQQIKNLEYFPGGAKIFDSDDSYIVELGASFNTNFSYQIIKDSPKQTILAYYTNISLKQNQEGTINISSGSDLSIVTNESSISPTASVITDYNIYALNSSSVVNAQIGESVLVDSKATDSQLSFTTTTSMSNYVLNQVVMKDIEVNQSGLYPLKYIEIQDLDGLFSSATEISYRFEYHDYELKNAGLENNNLSLYRYNSGPGTWTEIPTTLNKRDRYIRSNITEDGLYGIFSSNKPPEIVAAFISPEITNTPNATINLTVEISAINTLTEAYFSYTATVIESIVNITEVNQTVEINGTNVTQAVNVTNTTYYNTTYTYIYNLTYDNTSGMYKGSFNAPNTDQEIEITITVKDSKENTATATTIFIFDMTLPEISVISPTNTTYVTDAVPLNYGINELVDDTGYIIDNVSVSLGAGNYYDTNITGLSDGYHNITIYAYDKAGNYNITESIQFMLVSHNVKTSNLTLPVYYRKAQGNIHEPAPISFEVENTLSKPEGDINITLYADSTLLYSGLVNLTEKEKKLIEYSWENTADFAEKHYTITANATLAGDSYLDDNYAEGELLVTSKIPVLIVKDSLVNASEQAYIDAIISATGTPGFDYILEESQNVDLSYLSNFGIVIWYASNETLPLSEEERTLLSDYLDKGGYLIISGEKLGEQNNRNNFYKNYLKAFYLGNSSDTHLEGISGDQIGDGLELIIQPETEILVVQSTNTDAFLYERDLGENTVAIHSETDIYKTIYLAFSFEKINNDFGYRDLLMQRMLDWLALDIFPPEITITEPLNNTRYEKDTKNISFRLTTDENANCSYTIDNYVSFDAMALLETTGAKNHRTIISNLSNGGNYTLYYGCIDDFRNKRTGSVIFIVNNRTYLPPIITMNSTFYGYENSTIKIPLIASDPENDTISLYSSNANFTLVNAANSTYFVWNASFDDSGIHDITITAFDGFSNTTKEIEITIVNVNRRPYFTTLLTTEFITEGVYYSRNITAVDPDDDTIFFYINTTSMFSINTYFGTLTHNPNDPRTGNFTYRITATDGDLNKDMDVLFVIGNVNDPPVLQFIPNLEAFENQSFYYDVNASDIENNTLFFYDNSSIFNISLSSGEINFTPVQDDVGQYSVLIWVNDGQYNDSQNVNFIVYDYNLPPIITFLENITIKVGEIGVINVTACDPDTDPGCS